MTEPKFTKEEKEIMISILEQVSIQGTEMMKHVVSISNKIKKAIEPWDPSNPAYVKNRTKGRKLVLSVLFLLLVLSLIDIYVN